MNHFPIVCTPPSLEQAQSSTPPEASFSQKPPEKPEDEPIQKNAVSIVLQAAGAAISSFVISVMFPIPIGVLLLIATGAISYSAWHQHKSYARKKQAYRLELARYAKDLIEHRNRKKAHLSQWRRRQIQLALDCTQPHSGEGSSAPEGKSEKIFRGHLERYFLTKIHSNLTYKVAGHPYPYTPDIAYIDRSINLYIDIEVDEPYVYTTKEPTHYKASKKDRTRNQFFTEKGWIVIRFSEQQVVCHPDSCCKVVAQKIYQVTEDSSIMSPFINIPNLRQHRQWTRKEAITMAKRKARDKYLLTVRPRRGDIVES